MLDRAKYDKMTPEQVLNIWQEAKKSLANAKEHEMDLRKYIVEKAFPQASEGTNNLPLNDGSTLKAVVKYNYKLDSDLNNVRKAASQIMAIGNQGQFIAERLFKWSCDLSLSEYRSLENAETNDLKEIKKLVDTVVTIEPAAPTLEIKEAKKK